MKKNTILGAVLLLLTSCADKPNADATAVDRQPTLWPEVAGATVPVNIAAPTFSIIEEAERYYTEIGLPNTDAAITINSKSPKVKPDLDDWRKLLSQAAGGDIEIRVTTQRDGKWERLAPVTLHVSDYSIDGYLIYRLLYPGYELWNRMGIYQRSLCDYNQTAVIENDAIGGQCINCHNFPRNNPDTMMLHVRGKQGGTLIARGENVVKVNPKSPDLPHGATYPAWHPSGRFIAFSANDINQFFHTSGTKTIEVSDMAADMTVYDVERGKTYTSPAISGDEWIETFPAWAPDGETLYYCRASAYTPGEALDSIRYDLCRVAFDTSTCTFGEPEVVIAASDEGKSISFPRVSPDGRYILYTQSDYGNFTIWHPESDLWLLDLSDGSRRSADEINSTDVDSYHSWSSDGRWVVFSSKRMDGLWARPFIASFDPETARFGTPFVLPQSEPEFYDNFTRTFNIPELVTGPVEHGQRLVQAVGMP